MRLLGRSLQLGPRPVPQVARVTHGSDRTARGTIARMRPDELVALNGTRAELGLNPITTEFGWRGFPNLDTGFLKRKAAQQLRDSLGRWRDQRGTITPEKPYRATTGRRTGPGPSAAPRTLPPPDPSIPTATRLDPDQAEARLTAIGYNPRNVDHWLKRGVIYEHPTEPGENPVFAFVATPDAMVESRMGSDHQSLVLAQENYDDATFYLESALALLPAAQQRAADGEPGADVELAEDLKFLKEQQDFVKAAEKRLQRTKAAVAEAEAGWRKMYGYGGVEAVGEPQQRVVDDATNVLAESLRKTSTSLTADKRNGSPKPYMLQFDHSEMPADPDGYPLGASFLGASTTTIDIGRYFDHPTDVNPDPDWFMPTNEQFIGRHVVRHELGHMIDSPAMWAESSLNDENYQPYDNAMQAGGMSGYGESGGMAEAYAEVYALWLVDPDNPVVQGYAEHFGWNK